MITWGYDPESDTYTITVTSKEGNLVNVIHLEPSYENFQLALNLSNIYLQVAQDMQETAQPALEV